MSYLLAWLIWGLATAIVIGCGLWLTRWIQPRWLRTLIRVLAIATLLVPAPAGSVDGVYGPAWLVVIFEAFLQPQGQPAAALSALLLAWGAALIWVLVLLVRGLRRGS